MYTVNSPEGAVPPQGGRRFHVLGPTPTLTLALTHPNPDPNPNSIPNQVVPRAALYCGTGVRLLTLPTRT